MGASGWFYVTPFSENVEGTFRKLRHDVYRERRFYQLPESALRSPAELEDEAAIEAEVIRQTRALLADSERRAQLSQHQLNSAEEMLYQWERAEETYGSSEKTTGLDREIEQLVARYAENGTHSILDVDRIGDPPGFGVVTRLTDDALLELFGSTTPTRDDASEKQAGAIAQCPRWQGVYFLVYREDGTPCGIAFAGCSGD